MLSALALLGSLAGGFSGGQDHRRGQQVVSWHVWAKFTSLLSEFPKGRLSGSGDHHGKVPGRYEEYRKNTSNVLGNRTVLFHDPGSFREGRMNTSLIIGHFSNMYHCVFWNLIIVYATVPLPPNTYPLTNKCCGFSRLTILTRCGKFQNHLPKLDW